MLLRARVHASPRGLIQSTNNLILNLKKSVERRSNVYEYRHKLNAIRQCGDLLRSVLNPDWIKLATLVPVPCSKTREHSLYDDRMLQVVRRMAQRLPNDIRELVIQTDDLESFHGGFRLRPRDLSEYYKLDEELCTGAEPTEIAIFDDLLTTGSHFKAMKLVLRSMFPGVPISGLFIARRYVVREQGGEGEI